MRSPPTWQTSAPLLELGAHEQRLLDSLFDSLRAAQDTFDGSAAAYRIMELVVGAVATQLAALQDRDGSAADSTSELTKAFLTAVTSTGRARTVDEVAATLGYSPRHLTNASHFSRAFKRGTGHTASSFRKAHRVH